MEVLVVVFLITILAAIFIPHYMEKAFRTKIFRTRSDLRSVGVAVESYVEIAIEIGIAIEIRIRSR